MPIINLFLTSGAIELYTKDTKLPIELRNLPYDVDSVTHFGDRDFSKNGHRTFIIKDRNVKQNRNGLSDIDLRKIQIVYGPECQKRDRQEKIELCQIYPGAVRRKRDTGFENKNLRVNRDITPPPEYDLADDVEKSLDELEIREEVEEIIDQVYKTVVSVAIENIRKKYCNKTATAKLKRSIKDRTTTGDAGVLKIMAAIANFTKSVVDDSMSNLTGFCETMNLLGEYPGRTACRWGSEDPRCPLYYRSTKSGDVKHHTQHRPVMYPSTKHKGQRAVYQYGLRSDNVTDNVNATRRKREAHDESNFKHGETTRKIDVKEKAGRIESKKTLRSVSTIKNVKKRLYVTRRSADERFR